jgi:hypothetical protein
VRGQMMRHVQTAQFSELSTRWIRLHRADATGPRSARQESVITQVPGSAIHSLQRRAAALRGTPRRCVYNGALMRAELFEVSTLFRG